MPGDPVLPQVGHPKGQNPPQGIPFHYCHSINLYRFSQRILPKFCELGTMYKLPKNIKIKPPIFKKSILQTVGLISEKLYEMPAANLQQDHFLYGCGDGLHMSTDGINLRGEIAAEFMLEKRAADGKAPNNK